MPWPRAASSTTTSSIQARCPVGIGNITRVSAPVIRPSERATSCEFAGVPTIARTDAASRGSAEAASCGTSRRKASTTSSVTSLSTSTRTVTRRTLPLRPAARSVPRPSCGPPPARPPSGSPARPGSELAVQLLDDLLSLVSGHVGETADLDVDAAEYGAVAGERARSGCPRVPGGIRLGECVVAYAGDMRRRVADRLQGGYVGVESLPAGQGIDRDLQQGAAGAVVFAREDLAFHAAGLRLGEGGAGNLRCCPRGKIGAYVNILGGTGARLRAGALARRYGGVLSLISRLACGGWGGPGGGGGGPASGGR